jgi:hypothetical protein
LALSSAKFRFVFLLGPSIFRNLIFQQTHCASHQSQTPYLSIFLMQFKDMDANDFTGKNLCLPAGNKGNSNCDAVFIVYAPSANYVSDHRPWVKCFLIQRYIHPDYDLIRNHRKK